MRDLPASWALRLLIAAFPTFWLLAFATTWELLRHVGVRP